MSANLCPNCNQPYRSGARFCSTCRYQLTGNVPQEFVGAAPPINTIICPHCNQVNQPGAMVCQGCALSLMNNVPQDAYKQAGSVPPYHNSVAKQRDVYNYQAPGHQNPPPPPPYGPNFSTDMVRAIAATKSYIGPAILTLALYWFTFWIGGVIANIIYLYSANNAQRLSGVAPEGKGCLIVLLVTHVILPIISVIMILVFMLFIGISEM